MIVTHPNGYSAELKDRKYTVFKDGEEVFSVEDSNFTEDDIYKDLERMPRLAEVVRVISE